MTDNGQSTAVALPAPQVSEQDLNIYREHFCKQATPIEWKIFVQKCLLYGLNPMRNEIYLVCRYTKDGPSYSTQISITGLISKAEETGRYEGTTKPVYYDAELNAYPVWPISKGPHPYAVSIGVYKSGHREPYVATLCFHERAQYKKDGSLMPMWQQQGIHMLLKCTLAAALRWEFAEACTGLYIHEEMHMADSRAQSVRVVPDVSENGNPALLQSASVGLKIGGMYKKCEKAGLFTDAETFYAFCGDVLDASVTRENASSLTPEQRKKIDTAIDDAIAKLHPAVVESEPVEQDEYISVDQLSAELSAQRQSA